MRNWLRPSIWSHSHGLNDSSPGKQTVHQVALVTVKVMEVITIVTLTAEACVVYQPAAWLHIPSVLQSCQPLGLVLATPTVQSLGSHWKSRQVKGMWRSEIKDGKGETDLSRSSEYSSVSLSSDWLEYSAPLPPHMRPRWARSPAALPNPVYFTNRSTTKKDRKTFLIQHPFPFRDTCSIFLSLSHAIYINDPQEHTGHLRWWHRILPPISHANQSPRGDIMSPNAYTRTTSRASFLMRAFSDEQGMQLARHPAEAHHKCRTAQPQSLPQFLADLRDGQEQLGSAICDLRTPGISADGGECSDCGCFVSQASNKAVHLCLPLQYLCGGHPPRFGTEPAGFTGTSGSTLSGKYSATGPRDWQLPGPSPLLQPGQCAGTAPNHPCSSLPFPSCLPTHDSHHLAHLGGHGCGLLSTSPLVILWGTGPPSSCFPVDSIHTDTGLSWGTGGAPWRPPPATSAAQSCATICGSGGRGHRTWADIPAELLHSASGGLTPAPITTLPSIALPLIHCPPLLCARLDTLPRGESPLPAGGAL